MVGVYAEVPGACPGTVFSYGSASELDARNKLCRFRLGSRLFTSAVRNKKMSRRRNRPKKRRISPRYRLGNALSISNASERGNNRKKKRVRWGIPANEVTLSYSASNNWPRKESNEKAVVTSAYGGEGQRPPCHQTRPRLPHLLSTTLATSFPARRQRSHLVKEDAPASPPFRE